MAENEPTKKPAAAKADEAEADDDGTTAPAVNPVDLGTDLDKLPPVPGAGQFMDAEDATEPTAAPEAPKKG